MALSIEIQDAFARLKRLMRKALSIYGKNAEGHRAAFILPDVSSIAGFVPDPDGVNLDGSKVARLIYQARFPTNPPGPPLTNNSRVGAWLSTIWEPRTGPVTAKASHYSLYILCKNQASNQAFPQEASALTLSAVQEAGCEHGKTETLITVAAHERIAVTPDEAHGLLTEDGDSLIGEDGDVLYEEDDRGDYQYVNGKLVVHQQVLRFDGPDPGWDYDPGDDDEDSGADPSENDEAATPRTTYPGYGTAWNNAGLTSGFAAGIVKARKPELLGTPWHHGIYVKKDAVRSFSFRHKTHFGVCAVGFNPGDAIGARAMPYMGVGIDLALAPLHLKGPVTLEHRSEYTGDASAPYALASHVFRGKNDTDTQALEMAGHEVNVTDPTKNSEDAEHRWWTRIAGIKADRLALGAGLYTPNATGGDPGTDGINCKFLEIDGFIELGDDPTAPDPVTPTNVTRTKDGMMAKAVAPSDPRIRSVNVYVNVGSDDAAAAFLAGAVDNHPCVAGHKIRWPDHTAYASGAEVYVYFASVSRKLVEGVLTLIGHAPYTAIGTPDLESQAVTTDRIAVDAVGTLDVGHGDGSPQAFAAFPAGSNDWKSVVVTDTELNGSKLKIEVSGMIEIAAGSGNCDLVVALYLNSNAVVPDIATLQADSLTGPTDDAGVIDYRRLQMTAGQIVPFSMISYQALAARGSGSGNHVIYVRCFSNNAITAQFDTQGTLLAQNYKRISA